VDDQDTLMRVPAMARRSVVFLGRVDERGAFVATATGFLVSAWEKGLHLQYPCLVTAQHVIAGMHAKGYQLYCRLNMKDGSVEITSLQDAHWWMHPGGRYETDVAITPFGFDLPGVDHDFIPLYYTAEIEPNLPVQTPEYGLGDEVFILGLFRSHYGQQRNIPIVRIGNIAAMPEEPVQTEAGLVEAYLIEARSIGGLSGSPVFLSRSVIDRIREGSAFAAALLERQIKRPPDEIHWPYYNFLGLMLGHFDVANLYDDIAQDGASRRVGIHTGIGVVIPAQRVFETLYQPDFRSERRLTDEQWASKYGVTLDITE
jgi:hypothetical protein